MRRIKICFLASLLFYPFISSAYSYSQNSDSLEVIQIKMHGYGDRGSPIYQIEYNNNGIADYKARGGHLGLRGHYSAALDTNDFKECNNLIINGGFDKLQDSYTSRVNQVADLDWATIEVRYNNGNIKTVREYAREAPEPFGPLRKLLWSLQKKLKWEKVDDQTP